VLNDRTAWLYYDFALVFFQGERFRLSEEILTDLSEWAETDVRASANVPLRANALYLLALIGQQAGRTPEALRIAQRATEIIDQAKPNQRPINLVTGLGVTLSRHGWGGDTGLLKPRVTDLIAALRQDPNAPL
jgi:hypothetical protein